MRDYVIINGVSSLTITGLAISKLPPITKPMIRTNIEEIDGRDGDLITELGYSAYDKELEIGLYNNFDINKIIKYFTGEGTIVFSNEPDKYYNFKIVNQIDYEKLLKFKTATVTIHCQPFKYPLSETPIELTPTTLTGSGTEITINDTREADMQLEYGGNTSQDYPQEVHVVSGDNTITVSNGDNTQSKSYPINLGEIELCKIGDYQDRFFKTSGKNLLETDTISYAQSGTYNLTLGNDIEVGTYSFSGITNATSGAFVLYGIDENNTQETLLANKNWNTISTGYNFTTTKKYVSLKIYTNASATGFIMLNEGTTALPYEPYGSNEWYLEKKIGKVEYDGSNDESWSYGNQSTQLVTRRFIATIDDIKQGTNNEYPCLCNRFKQGPNSVDNFVFITTGSGKVWFGSTTLSSLDTSGFRTWLSTHNTILYYILATPTYTKITDSTLLSQLEAIKRSYEGQTNITQTNDDLPFNLDVSMSFLYPLTVNNVGNIYSKPVLEIEGSGNIGVVLNGIQILEIALGDVGKIAIDVPNLEAFNPDDNSLLNRLVTGDYMKLLINEGNNTIAFDGNVTKATLSKYTRWI